MEKWCYADPNARLKCIMDLKNKSRQKKELEANNCSHLTQGKDKETCEYYLVARKKDRNIFKGDQPRCCSCGRFVNPSKAKTEFIPDSDYTEERLEWICEKCQ